MTSTAFAASDRGGLRFASTSGRWVLLATVLGSAVASIDATVVGIARPAIGRTLGVGLSTLQWVVTAYTLLLAGLLLIVGALGDKYGRKRIFLTGVTWFACASGLSGIAPSAPLSADFRTANPPLLLASARSLRGRTAQLSRLARSELPSASAPISLP